MGFLAGSSKKKWLFLRDLLSGFLPALCLPCTQLKLMEVLNGYFKGSQGLRQGDPLSPYLFTIAMNVFSCLLDEKPANFKHHWKCKELGITHLLFADDVLLFMKGNKDSISHIMNDVHTFSSISGLHPSLHKSTVFFGNCNREVINWFDSSLQYSSWFPPCEILRCPSDLF